MSIPQTNLYDLMMRFVMLFIITFQGIKTQTNKNIGMALKKGQEFWLTIPVCPYHSFKDTSILKLRS